MKVQNRERTGVPKRSPLGVVDATGSVGWPRAKSIDKRVSRGLQFLVYSLCRTPQERTWEESLLR